MQTSTHSTVVMHTAMIQPKFTSDRLEAVKIVANIGICIDMYIGCLYCYVVADIFNPGLLSTGYYPCHPSLPLLH